MPNNAVNRRTALQVIATLIAAFGGGTVEGEEPKPKQSIYMSDPNQPRSIYIRLEQLTYIEVTFKGQSVRIDPAEMFRALKEPR